MGEARSGCGTRWAGALMGAGLVALVFAVYWQVGEAGFIWDDEGLAVGNPAVRAVGGLADVWRGVGQKAYHPVTTSLWWLEYRLWGEWAAGWHWVNVALHALNAVLVWRLLRTMGVAGAWGAGAVFAVHPVCVESVAWVSETKNGLSLAFALLTLRAMWRAEEGGWTARGYGVSLVLFGLALLSKSTVAPLPAIWLVLLWWRRGGRVGREDIWRSVPMFVMSGVAGLLAVWFEWGEVLRGEAVRDDGVAGRLLGAAVAVWFYLWKLVAPVGLSMIYPRWEIGAGDAVGWAAVGALAVVAGALRYWRGRDWGRAGIAAGACFVLAVLPVSGVVDISYFRYSLVADHFQYVGMIAVIAAGVGAGARILGPLRGAAVLTVVVGVFAVMTWRQVGVYADARTLWGDVVAKNPGAWAAWVNLGNAWLKEGRVGESEGAYRRALELRPGEPVASLDLGMVLARRGEWGEALRHLERGREVAAGVPAGSYLLGRALRESGRGREAAEWYRRAVVLDSAHADARAELGGELLGLGRVGEGVGELREALRLRGDWVDVMNNLAWVLATCEDGRYRDGGEAVRLAERACLLTGYEDAATLDTLSAAYAECGRYGEAVGVAKRAIERARAAGDAALGRELAGHLERYERGEAVRGPG